MKPKSSKVKLSSGVLQMKFMKRTAIAQTEEIAKEEQKRLIDDEHWYLSVEEKNLKSNGRAVLVEPSYSIFEEIGFGRMSFNGFNPVIEKIMNPPEVVAEPDEEKEVDDDAMADHYQRSLHKTISKKFSRAHTGSGNKVNKDVKHKVKRL